MYADQYIWQIIDSIQSIELNRKLIHLTFSNNSDKAAVVNHGFLAFYFANAANEDPIIYQILDLANYALTKSISLSAYLMTPPELAAGKELERLQVGMIHDSYPGRVAICVDKTFIFVWT